MDRTAIFAVQLGMTRCQSCDAILRKEERTCFRCGDPAPEDGKTQMSGFTLLLSLAFVASVAFVGYSFWMGRLP
jgi:hypothetical protein